MNKSSILLLLALNSVVVLFQLFEVIFSDMRSLNFVISFCILVTSFGFYCYALSLTSATLAVLKEEETKSIFNISLSLMTLGLIFLFSPYIFGFINGVVSGVWWALSTPFIVLFNLCLASPSLFVLIPILFFAVLALVWYFATSIKIN